MQPVSRMFAIQRRVKRASQLPASEGGCEAYFGMDALKFYAVHLTVPMISESESISVKSAVVTVKV